MCFDYLHLFPYKSENYYLEYFYLFSLQEACLFYFYLVSFFFLCQRPVSEMMRYINKFKSDFGGHIVSLERVQPSLDHVGHR